MIPGIVAASAWSAPDSGGGPIVMPEDAIYFTSFKNGTYWNGGTTTLGAVWISDPNWGTWDSSATLVPALGLQNTSSDGAFDSDPSLDPSLIAALKASGTTIVLDFTLETSGNVRFDLFKDDYSVEFFAEVAHLGSNYIQAGAVFADSVTSLAAGPHRAAMTITSTKIAISVDGETTVAATHTAVLADVNSFGLGVTLGVLDVVMFLPPRADADLPDLSTL